MLELYYRIDQAIGVDIHLLADGRIQVNACSVVVANNRLDFEKKVIDLDAVEELSRHFPPKSRLALNLFGKGILQKQIERIEEIGQGNFSQLLPNANFDDFYIQHFISGERSFVSIIRKQEADKWIDRLKKQGFVPLMMSLGPFPVQQVVSQLNVYDQELVFNGHRIQRNAQSEWMSCQYHESALAPFPLKVESEAIDEKLVVAYAVAFQLALAAKFSVIQAGVPSLDIAFKNHIASKKFRVNAFLILAVFFILLLINFLVFTWINAANIELTDRVSRSAQSTSNLAEVKEQVNDKQFLLKSLGWDGGINKSALIDQLASLLPTDISWRELAINPIEPANNRAQRSLQFRDRSLRVTGNAEKIIPVNEWIARVKTKKWVKNIQLDSYTYNSELNTGQFIVLIAY